MSINIGSVAERTFNLLKGFGFAVQSFDLGGKIVVDPREATRFAVDKPNVLVRLDQSDDSLTLNTSEDLSDPTMRKLHKMLKHLSQDYLLNFDYNVFGRTIKPKGESQNIAKNSEKDMSDVMEASLGRMTGSIKTSKQQLENIKIIVRHKKPVNEEIRGARSRNIQGIYIQRGDERFKMTENDLLAARAMVRHIAMGGEVHDIVGTAINEMATECKKMKEFVRYVNSAKLINEENADYIQLAVDHINEIKTNFKKLSGSKSYSSMAESIATATPAPILEDDADIQSKFTETHFDPKVANVMSNLASLSYKKKAFEAYIDSAIKKESFEGLTTLLHENDSLDFATPHAKLSHQVSQLGYSATDEQLGSYLRNLSSKINNGGGLTQHEYGTIKSCLSVANTGNLAASLPIPNVTEAYAAFFDRFNV